MITHGNFSDLRSKHSGRSPAAAFPNQTSAEVFSKLRLFLRIFAALVAFIGRLLDRK